ncbi:MAG: superoxide dismutase, partial [Chitinophagales bacterium]|nr:superoxide dismutase [Chitinophagales bacterium]
MKSFKFSALVVLILIGTGLSVIAQPFYLPKLNYGYDALEPYIDAQTMEIHYSKHHLGYVNNLNKAIKGTRAENLSIEEIMVYAGRRGDAVRNNSGGHYNHSLFWSILSPNAAKFPSGMLDDAINMNFSSL